MAPSEAVTYRGMSSFPAAPAKDSLPLKAPKAPKTRRHLSRPVVAGVVTALVGFTSSFAVVLAGLRAVGADPGQAASGLLALTLAFGVAVLWLSWRSRVPVTLAWSTPGAALLAGSGTVDGGWPAAVGAFLVAGVLIALTGLSAPLGRLLTKIPTAAGPGHAGRGFADAVPGAFQGPGHGSPARCPRDCLLAADDQVRAQMVSSGGAGGCPRRHRRLRGAQRRSRPAGTAAGLDGYCTFSRSRRRAGSRCRCSS